jgi:hypothetical protein
MKYYQYPFIAILLFYFSYLCASQVWAYDYSLPNNKFGMHLAQPNTEDIKGVARLVNSNGGKWGYVTLVIQQNDRDKNKWQDIFDLLREEKLIPIIRLATEPEGGAWKKPSKEDAGEWAHFLNSLHWPVRNRYVVLFNEPNHAGEWGGAVEVESFTDVSYAFAKTLKESNRDFFVMLAGFDAAAPQALPQYGDEAYFLRTMLRYAKEKNYSLFDHIDGWSSHSYPNPGFSGSPWASGRNTIRTYQWELDYLKDLGISKDLPVFITETGWINPVPASYFTTAFDQAWLPDNRIIAVTPFVFSYIGEPFARFSWQRDETSFYSHYDEVMAFEKTRGEPEIIDTGSIVVEKPRELVQNSTYHLTLNLHNTGQAIWDVEDGYYFDIEPKSDLISISHSFTKLLPLQKTAVTLHVKTGELTGKGSVTLNLYYRGKKVATAGEWAFEVLPLPSLQMGIKLLGRTASGLFHIKAEIYDKKEELVYKAEDVSVRDGQASIANVPGVILGEFYRIVILKPYYLPRQNHVKFMRGTNKTEFEPMLPIDLNADGKLGWEDIGTAITNPLLFKTILSN